MHAAVYRARMTEETFQVLLDVMERHFAALSLPDPATDPKITRAISFSELPLTRKILIEQCYQHDDSGNLVRQYSCEQIFDKSSNTREVKVSEIVKTGSERCLTNTWKTTFPVFGTLGNAGWHSGQFGQLIKAIEPKPINQKPRKKMESMEIEEIERTPFDGVSFRKPKPPKEEKVPTFELNGMTLIDGDRNNKPLIRASTFGLYSTGAGTAVNIPKQPAVKSRSVSPKKSTTRAAITNFNNPESSNTNEVIVQKSDYNATKKKLRSLVPDDKTKTKNSRYSCSCYKFIFFILLTCATAILAIILYDEDVARNRRGLDFTNMSLELKQRVYGQDEALRELINDLRKSSSGINLVTLVGGTGVGKSYTVSIVIKHFPHVNHVFEYFPPLHKTVQDAFGSLSRRHCNLVVLENLNIAHLRDAATFVKFMREQKEQFCVYTIAVINPHESGDTLATKFDMKKSVDEISETLKKRGLEDNSRVIAFAEHDQRSLDACIRKAAEENEAIITELQLVDIRRDLLTANSGCKGAYAKVQLLKKS